MQFNNLKKLRINNNLTQQQISNIINVNRKTYNNWEQNIVVVPLNKLDELALYYKVSLAYILGITNEDKKQLLKPLDYYLLLKNLKKLKIEHNNSYGYLANKIKCHRSTCERYFNGKVIIPSDRLILIAKIYKKDLDELCGKR